MSWASLIWGGGGGTKKDPLKAVQWYRRSAALGDVSAQYKMGMILLKGLLGRPIDPLDPGPMARLEAEFERR